MPRKKIPSDRGSIPGLSEHIVRMDKERTVKRIREWRTTAAGKIGRPRLRWQEEFREDLGKIKIQNWTKTAMGREWMRIVKQVRAHKRPGRDADRSPPSSAVGQERVELYLYSPYGPYSLYRASVPVQGCILPLPLPLPLPFFQSS